MSRKETVFSFGLMKAIWQRNKLTKPLSKRALRKFRRILKGIKSGALAHEQGRYHCNTGHCIAGWNEALDLKDAVLKAKPDYKLPKFLGKTFFHKNKSVWRSILRKASNLWEEKFGRQPDALINTPNYRGVTANFYTRADWELSEDEALVIFAGDNTIEELETTLSMFEQGYRVIGTESDY